MKRIINSLSIIAIVAGITIGSTGAYFSDTETSTGNTFTAGTMDLNIDDGNEDVAMVTLTDLDPGDASRQGLSLKNVGSIEGELDVAMGIVTNHACASTWGLNDGTEYCLDTAGALGAVTQMALYIDVDGISGYQDGGGDIGLDSAGNRYVTGTLRYDDIDSYSTVSWNNVYSGLMPVGDVYPFTISWNVPITATNEIQGDALSFNMTFTLEQPDVD